METSRRNSWQHLLLVFLVLVALLILLPMSTIRAADITVNSGCSLANAITASNTDTATGGCSAGSGVDTISLSGSITLSAALPQITTSVTINGNGHSIDGASSYRIFHISTPYHSDGNSAAQRIFTINNLTMRNGSSSEGGTIVVEGARADNLASLTLSNCNVYNSRSSANAGGIRASNALLNVGPTTLMSGNSAAHSGGGIWADHSTVNVFGGSTLTYNGSGVYGGSIFAMDTTLKLENAAVTHSTATDQGGGIAFFRGSGRTMTINRAVVNDNTAGMSGGGIYTTMSDATVAINNSTFFNNRGQGQDGADNWDFNGSGTVTVDGENLHY